MSQTATANASWISSPKYDLSFIFGGAALTLAVPAVASLAPTLLVPLFFWVWVFFFEGSHFWATYSRTYMDAKFRNENKGVLSFSLLYLLLPAAMVGLSVGIADSTPMNVYGFFIFSWSLYHNTRQHYGFVSIYNRKVGASDETMQKFRWGMYLATFAPMAHFFLSYKLGADFPVLFQSLSSTDIFSRVVMNIPRVMLVVSALYFAWLGALTIGGQKGAGSPIALAYILTCLVFYNTMFFVIAPMEPFFQGPQNFSQKLMVISIMNSLFHNIQYHAIVWYYSRKRYADAPSEGFFGMAKSINSKFPTYAMASLGFSVLFTLVFWLRAEIPFLTGSISAGSMTNLAYILYFGVVGQHFYLDQKIWRVSRSKDLTQYLSLPQTMGAIQRQQVA